VTAPRREIGESFDSGISLMLFCFRCGAAGRLGKEYRRVIMAKKARESDSAQPLRRHAVVLK